MANIGREEKSVHGRGGRRTSAGVNSRATQPDSSGGDIRALRSSAGSEQ